MPVAVRTIVSITAILLSIYLRVGSAYSILNSENLLIVVPIFPSVAYDIKYDENTLMMKDSRTQQVLVSYQIPNSCEHQKASIVKRHRTLLFSLPCIKTSRQIAYIWHLLFYGISCLSKYTNTDLFIFFSCFTYCVNRLCYYRNGTRNRENLELRPRKCLHQKFIDQR